MNQVVIFFLFSSLTRLSVNQLTKTSDTWLCFQVDFLVSQVIGTIKSLTSQVKSCWFTVKSPKRQTAKMSGALSKFWKETHQFFITGAVMSLGDTVSQKLIEKKQEFDVARNARFAALGLFFVVSIFSVFVSAKGKNTFAREADPRFVRKKCYILRLGGNCFFHWWLSGSFVWRVIRLPGLFMSHLC